MPTRRDISFIAAIVGLLAFLFVSQGCLWVFFYPNPNSYTPRPDIRHESPKILADWTMRQTDSDDIWRGVGSFRFIAREHVEQQGAEANTNQYAREWKRFIQKADGAEWCSNIIPPIYPDYARLYRYWAELSMMTPEPLTTYNQIRPLEGNNEHYLVWLDVGAKAGVFEKHNQDDCD